MTQDFYQRTQALYEEFQKRELHYLNAEKQWSSMIWKKDPNPSLQEYLQKINQREKETEETYNNVMKQMTELDKRTHMMSLKLEKLGILRSSVATSAVPYGLPNLPGSNLHLYETASSLSAKTSAFNFSGAENNLKSVSTQTQNKIYCDKCNSQVFEDSHHSIEIENFSKSSPSRHSVEKFIPQTSYLSKPLYSSTPLKENESLSKSASSPVPSINLSAPINTDKSLMIESKMDGQINSQISKQDIHSSALINENRPVPQSKEVQLNKSNDAESNKPQSSVKKTMEISKTETKSTVGIKSKPPYSIHDKNELSYPVSNKNESSHPVINKSESSHPVNIEDTMDISVSKSDQESVNNEFDFLESDTVMNVKNLTSTKPDTSTSLQSINPSFVKTAQPGEKLLGMKNNAITKNRNSKVNITDDKSDTSGSVTEPPSPSIHSPNLSVASDSDSMGRKENPLTASAAYQALLGNTSVPVTASKKEYSDSESEDEVEHALASAVKKNNHVLPKSLPQPKKDEKSSPQQVESKPITKISKPTAVSKPQSKLSKSTRKVLGLDTSSGSEVELAVKPAEKKIEEDSDEFDFYG